MQNYLLSKLIREVKRIWYFYLAILMIPALMATIEYTKVTSQINDFGKTFAQYDELPCLVHNIDCKNHGYYDAKKLESKDDKVYAVTFPHTRHDDCKDVFTGMLKTCYFSRVNPHAMSFSPPDAVLVLYQRNRESFWIFPSIVFIVMFSVVTIGAIFTVRKNA